MRDRLGKFALSLHPDKTRLIEFGRFAATDRKLRGLGKPETLMFLGLHLHLWAITLREVPASTEDPTRPHVGKLKDIKAELRRAQTRSSPSRSAAMRNVLIISRRTSSRASSSTSKPRFIRR